MISLFSPLTFAHGVIPDYCSFQHVDLNHAKNTVASPLADETTYVVTVKNKVENCGDMRISLVGFSGGELANKLNAIIDKITPHDLIPLKSDPERGRDLLSKKFNEYEVVYYYEEKSNWLTNHVLSLTQTIYTFTGGAHGNTSVNKASYDIDSGNMISLSQVLSTNNIEALMAIAKSEFIHAHELSADKTLEEQGFWLYASEKPKDNPFVNADGFYLPFNFNLTENGIAFAFQQYEIAPYSMGVLEFILPWDKIQPYLVPGFQPK